MVYGVYRKRGLRLRVSKWNPRIISLPYRFECQIRLAAFAQTLLGAGKLDLSLFAQIIVECELQCVEYGMREEVHPKEAKIHSPEEAFDAQIGFRVFDVRLL